MVIVFVGLVDEDVNPNVGEGLKVAATKVNLTAAGIFNSFPLIVFAFMYQPNLPAVYHELRVRNMSSMWKVIISATTIACTCYFLAGYFGYATFATRDNAD